MKFRLVDKITSWAPYQHIHGIKTVSFEEYSLKEALGEEARLPETLLLESFLQLGNWLIMLSSEFKQMGMVVRISEVRFHDGLRPGQRLCLEARLIRRRTEGLELTGQGQVNGRTIISGLGCLAIPVPLAEHMNPEDMRVLFSELYSPPGAPAPLSLGAPASPPASLFPGAPASSPANPQTDKNAVQDAGAPGS